THRTDRLRLRDWLDGRVAGRALGRRSRLFFDEFRLFFGNGFRWRRWWRFFLRWRGRLWRLLRRFDGHLYSRFGNVREIDDLFARMNRGDRDRGHMERDRAAKGCRNLPSWWGTVRKRYRDLFF